MLVIVFILTRKKNSAYVVRLYRDGICVPAGHQFQFIRSDSDSVMGEQWLNELNKSLDKPMTILQPLSPAAMEEHQRGAGISVQKAGAGQHERMIERTIMVLQDDGINALMNQQQLPKEYVGYAMIDAGEKLNAMKGRLNMTRFQHFYGRPPSWQSLTSGSFGCVGITTRQPSDPGAKGTVSRNTMVVVMVSPLGLPAKLVLRAGDKTPVYRGNITIIPMGALKYSSAVWRSMQPTFNDKGQLVSVVVGDNGIVQSRHYHP